MSVVAVVSTHNGCMCVNYARIPVREQNMRIYYYIYNVRQPVLHEGPGRMIWLLLSRVRSLAAQNPRNPQHRGVRPRYNQDDTLTTIHITFTSLSRETQFFRTFFRLFTATVFAWRGTYLPRYTGKNELPGNDETASAAGWILKYTYGTLLLLFVEYVFIVVVVIIIIETVNIVSETSKTTRTRLVSDINSRISALLF